MTDKQEVKIGDAVLIVEFSEYERYRSYANVESVTHNGVDITEFVDDGVIGRALIAILDKQYDDENNARRFASHEDKKYASGY